MAAGLLRTARSGSVVLSLYPLSQPRDERRAEQSETRRRLADRPVSLKSPIPKNVYASAMGLCKDSIMTLSRKSSNSNF